jgi:hypothetical protein
MQMNKIMRPLHYHPEPIRFAQGQLREGSGVLGREMLRCAQHDRAGTHTDAGTNLFMCIIGPYDMAGVFRYSSLSRPHW